MNWFHSTLNAINLLDVTKTYVLSGGFDGDLFVYAGFLKNNTWVAERGTYVATKVKIDLSTVTAEYDTIRFSIGVRKGTTVDNVTIRPQLELGETATEYVPYRSPSTAVIYRSAPLKKGESVNFRSDRLPKLTLFEGENIITATTAIKPEKISVDYYEK